MKTTIIMILALTMLLIGLGRGGQRLVPGRRAQLAILMEKLRSTVCAQTILSRMNLGKQGSRCTSEACLPAHKCQQSRTDILDFDLAMIFTLFILRAILHSVLDCRFSVV